ncbi:MAG: histidine kinase [Bergeyella sp.]
MRNFKKYNWLRIFLNSILFGFILFAATKNNYKNLPFWFIFLYNFLLFVPAWINNFLLLPKLRNTKNLKKYFGTVSIMLFVTVIVLGKYLQWLYNQFNSNELIDFTPIGITSSPPGFLEKHQYYFDVFPGIILVMIMMFASYNLQNFLLKIKKEKQIKTEQNLAELNLLKSQISPHFLFNVLNSLYALSIKKSEETPDVILKLSDILRYSLYETKKREISIADEIHILNTYIDIEQLRLPENAKISFDYRSVKNSVKIAPMLLLPLIENAFKHGTDSTIGASYIDAILRCDENNLIFICKNNFKESAKKDAGGIGIENIKNRLKLLYPEKHKLEIEKNKDVFTINLEIKF